MDTSDRTILRRLILGLTLVVLVGVVVWVFFVRDTGKKNTSTKNGNTSQQTNNSGQAASGSSNQPGSGSQAQGNAASPSGSGSTNSTSGQPNTLAETGPGNVAALFAGAAAAGALGHHLYSRRRAKSV